MEEEDLFGADAPVVETETVEQPAIEQDVATEQVPPVAAPVVEAKPDPGFVPISVLLEERDKRKAAEALAQQYRPQQQDPQPIPDVLDDPEGFGRSLTSAAANQVLNVKLELSEDVARDKFGDAVVDAARDWAVAQFQARPGFQQQVLSQRNPYKFVVEQYQREQVASELTPDDVAQFKAWKAAQAQVAQQPTQPIPAAVTPPPQSLVSAPSAGSPKPPKVNPEEERLNAMFG